MKRLVKSLHQSVTRIGGSRTIRIVIINTAVVDHEFGHECREISVGQRDAIMALWAREESAYLEVDDE